MFVCGSKCLKITRRPCCGDLAGISHGKLWDNERPKRFLAWQTPMQVPFSTLQTKLGEPKPRCTQFTAPNVLSTGYGSVFTHGQHNPNQELDANFWYSSPDELVSFRARFPNHKQKIKSVIRHHPLTSLIRQEVPLQTWFELLSTTFSRSQFIVFLGSKNQRSR